MKRVLLICLVLLTFASCEKSENPDMPYAPVNFKVYLSGQDHDLNGILSYKTFTKPRLASEYVGYAGILVVCGFDNVYHAYELCCPHEALRNKTIVPNTDGTATCPSCNTVYDIGYGTGSPTSGPSKYMLRKFNTIPNGQELIIQY
ncbi:nitrite reductase/ring-hydroxylating ferredoxin subunit [Parabacteroides sp. PFB2-12]|uniref:hypothetical protein n=1 Tax=unclassified Parabacteroides TaxID=2649774 RepID=UPI002476583E|nr:MULTISPECIES: hypothetical protein [unclassified Parabacteroides]MDH6343143.1 nitrite reductase/ring-hydroxylating ferredoxin subunit [Parabacteroides sp. PM6-13]MDH6390787.1 nitrite reductase/ring-hydroxylating ferredoxin subunit [Parabacteroides sp. PFB2-12]